MDLEKTFDQLHQDCLDCIEHLMDLNPAEGTPEFNLLKNLAATVDQYERSRYPNIGEIKPQDP